MSAAPTSTATRDATLDQRCVDTIRSLAIDGVERAGSGHPGMPLGMAPVAYAPFARTLHHNPDDPRLEARTTLAAEGLDVRVVSMPSCELFAAQDATYRAEVLPAGVPAVAVEAAITLGWERWTHAAVGIDRFGASAPGAEALTRLGMTSQEVSGAVRNALRAATDTAVA